MEMFLHSITQLHLCMYILNMIIIFTKTKFRLVYKISAN